MYRDVYYLYSIGISMLFECFRPTALSHVYICILHISPACTLQDMHQSALIILLPYGRPHRCSHRRSMAHPKNRQPVIMYPKLVGFCC